MRGKGLTVLVLLGLVAGMGGLVAASVPLYELFCRVTGYGGTTRLATTGADEIADRVITVRFDASTYKDMPWHFAPMQREMRVRLGENALAWYVAENPTDEPIIGQATYNVAPAKAGAYFNKIECFCFTEQLLNPHERVEMPVAFYVDPALADGNAGEVTTITLSYTFFRAKNVKLGSPGNGEPGNESKEGRS